PPSLPAGRRRRRAAYVACFLLRLTGTASVDFTRTGKADFENPRLCNRLHGRHDSDGRFVRQVKRGPSDAERSRRFKKPCCSSRDRASICGSMDHGWIDRLTKLVDEASPRLLQISEAAAGAR